MAGCARTAYSVVVTAPASNTVDEASARARRPGESLLDWVERVDPDVARAIADVDRTLLTECLRLSPLDRLRACSGAARALGRFRVAP